MDGGPCPEGVGCDGFALLQRLDIPPNSPAMIDV
jgi:hypothetical protein